MKKRQTGEVAHQSNDIFAKQVFIILYFFIYIFVELIDFATDFTRKLYE